MQDRRQIIIEAGLATLRELGYAGFTQPQVAARASLRQSHLTYYYPTRSDLLAAVGRAASERILTAVDAVFDGPPERAAAALANVVSRHENPRVMIALAQAADQEPELRAVFCELADAIVARAEGFLRALNPSATEIDARLLHALSVGFAVVGLATGRSDNERIAQSVIDTVLAMIAARSGRLSSGFHPFASFNKGEQS
jgi:AcrR family transcriptional regulator